jgi:lysophospholipase L1-like esterase
VTRALAIALAPIVLIQARRLRRTVPRLPDADGPRSGSTAGPRPIRLAVIGDSTAVGAGVARIEDALPGALARELADGRGVEWTAIGRSGDTSGEVLASFGPTIADVVADVAVLLVGWNDAMRLRSARAYRHDLDALVDRIETASPRAQIVIVAPPAFARYDALPRPLRSALSAHAAGLTRVAARVASGRGAALVPGFDGAAVASDGFHPNAAGYARMATAIARVLDPPTKWK